MEIKVIRKIFDDNFTAGELYIDGEYVCDTLELKTRVLNTIEDKVPGKTAIPYGNYQVKITYSNRFKKFLPEIMNVSFFDATRLHSGNTIKDTRGCILVGDYVGNGTLAYSRNAMQTIMEKLIKDKDNLSICIMKE